jgi:hypothetical protein
MTDARHDTAEGTARRRGIGLSLPAVVLLAALAAVRLPLHDLGLVQDGSMGAGLLVFAPLAVWVAVALRSRVPNPFLTLLAVGAAYGVMLAIGHQLLWEAAFGGDPPRLGGNLAGVLAPDAEAVFFRVSAVFSSIFTGTMVGAVAGAVALAIKRATRLTRRTRCV